jgi:hypothetical protein
MADSAAVGTRCDVPSGRVILAFHLELPNVLTCRDRCAQVSRITWRTSVAHHPTEDTAHQVRCLTSFSTSSRRAPPGPESAPPPQDRERGLPSGSSPKGSEARLPLAWRARSNRVPVEDSRTRHQRSTPCLCTTRSIGWLPESVVEVGPPSDRRLPHRPASDHGKCGPARRASRAPPASQAIEQARPLDPHRAEPEVGSYRGDAERLPALRPVDR